jgi:hypothetical protein
MAAIPTSNCLDEPDIHTRQRLTRFKLIRRNFEQVVHPTHRQPEPISPDIDDQQCPFVFWEGCPIEQSVTVDDREKSAPKIDQAEDGVWGSRDSGNREGRQNFTGTAGEHPTSQIAHLKNDDAHRLRVSHLY